MIIEIKLNDTDEGKGGILRNLCPSATGAHKRIGIQSNPDICGKRLATQYLHYVSVLAPYGLVA
jgi:hypothetical protein